MDLHHPILREFPERRDTIKRLQGDAFLNLYDGDHRPMSDDLSQRRGDRVRHRPADRRSAKCGGPN